MSLGLSSAFGQTPPQLVCDSISASRSKCGFSGFEPGSTKFYLTTGQTWDYDLTYTGSDPPACHWTDNHRIQSDYDISTEPYCLSYTDTCTGDRVCNGTPSDFCSTNNLCSCRSGGSVNGSSDYVYSDTSAATIYTPLTNWSGHAQINFYNSNEYTTAMLISNTIAALPAYDGVYNDACGASRELSSDETSYSITRFRYKFTFPAATQPFTIHWVERFTPEGGGPPMDTPRSEQIPIGASESNVHEVLEPSSNGTVTILVESATVEVTSASIRDGEFVITVLDPSAATGTLDLILREQGSNNQIVLKTFQNQPSGTVTVRLDDVMNVDGGSPLDGQDGIVFDRAAARWRTGASDVTSADRNFDVPVEVLSQRTISNYFSPTWGGTWIGKKKLKGVYLAGQFPAGLYNVQLRTDFLNALDPKNEGLAMDGNTVIRAEIQPAQHGFQQYIFLNGTDLGYIEFPDRDQRNTATDSTVLFLRGTSVAVRPDADRVSYRTADQVYVPGFGVRTVDDSGDLHNNTHQIDVWRGQGDATLKAVVDGYSIKVRTCLKVLLQ
jgi:hypothetical protein